MHIGIAILPLTFAVGFLLGSIYGSAYIVHKSLTLKKASEIKPKLKCYYCETTEDLIENPTKHAYPICIDCENTFRNTLHKIRLNSYDK